MFLEARRTIVLANGRNKGTKRYLNADHLVLLETSETIFKDGYRRAQFLTRRVLRTTMPVARDSPSIQGDVPGPDPARAPPTKAIAQAGLACRGQPAGVYLAAKVRDAACRPRAGVGALAA